MKKWDDDFDIMFAAGVFDPPRKKKDKFDLGIWDNNKKRNEADKKKKGLGIWK